MSTKYNFDPLCLELASHFLPDDATNAAKNELAQVIQDAVDDHRLKPDESKPTHLKVVKLCGCDRQVTDGGRLAGDLDLPVLVGVSRRRPRVTRQDFQCDLCRIHVLRLRCQSLKRYLRHDHVQRVR
jgi:hypothetical protein